LKIDDMNQNLAVAPVVLFDGECGMCSAFVRFVLANSSDSSVVFIALGSAKGRQLLAKHGIDQSKTDSIVFIADGSTYIYSSAIIEMARSFRSPWNALRLLVFVPRFIRDGGYRLVARYRRKLIPLSKECPFLSPNEKRRIYLD
jgi:predicted DCC family thiol-disulfide oxidoreductase YuxK